VPLRSARDAANAAARQLVLRIPFMGGKLAIMQGPRL
jgi:hypothetical protein